MELWIRSQDKMKLRRVIDIGIFEEQEGYTIYYDDSIDDMLGTYATKERALEVLDEIQSKMREQFIVKSHALMSLADIDKEESRLNWKYAKEFIMQDSDFQIEPINTGIIVYEMPKE